MDLLKKCPFEFDQDKKLGHARCDFDGGREISPIVKWFSAEGFQEKTEEYDINHKDMDEAIALLCDEINCYSRLLDHTGDVDNPYDSEDCFFQHKNIDVWVRMIPAKDNYNMYINMYHQ